MSDAPRNWSLWGCRYENGTFRHIGSRRRAELHMLPEPIVALSVREVVGDAFAPDVTHYGWLDAKRDASVAPSMIQTRAGSDPKRAMMLLDICFAYGMKVEIEHGKGNVVALCITERTEASS